MIYIGGMQLPLLSISSFLRCLVSKLSYIPLLLATVASSRIWRADRPTTSEERMPRLDKLVVDGYWKEVVFANKYAMLIGYLSMAVKGLGFLVLTWTTVVLLGGFVSTLQNKDFWCLTFITLVQTAGIFDVSMTEKLRYIRDLFRGVLSVRYAVLRWENPLLHKRQMLANGIAYVQQAVFVILLCPLAAVYVSGLFISAAISLWRLRQHDYGIDADGAGHLKPALDVLYSLALLQGVIFLYKAILGFAKGSVVNTIVDHRQFGDESRAGISDYLAEMVTGCEKDPSFARGRNLITYAVDLMRSNSPDDYLSGLRILDTFTARTETVVKEWRDKNTPMEELKLVVEHIVMKHLVIYASSSDILRKLLQTLSWRSIYYRETRVGAARIVASIAFDIRLEEFPWGIRYISSLIDSFEEYRLLQPYMEDWLFETLEQDWYVLAPKLASWHADKDVDVMNIYKELVAQGFRILWKLAANHENCIVMLNTPFLLHKIMAPVTSDLLHHVDHDAWSSTVEGSLKVMAQLIMIAQGQTGTKLRSDISSSKEAMNTMERILQCDKCGIKLQKHVIWILTHLYKDAFSVLDTARREKFIKMLVDITTDDNEDKEPRQLEATKALIALSSEIKTSATIIMKVHDNVVDNLTTMVDVGQCVARLLAARLLENLCCHYTDDDESLKKLKKAMTDSVPKLLGDVYCFWASEETHIGIEVDQIRSALSETDVENQCGDNDQLDNSLVSSDGGTEKREYAAPPLFSLCVTVCDTLISADQDLAHLFDAIPSRGGAFSFPLKLKKIVKKNMHPREDCLEIVKLACKMVISMMKHRGTYVKEDLESLMDTIASASKEMFVLDGSLVFRITQDKPFRSLASLVKEARELVDQHYGLSS